MSRIALRLLGAIEITLDGALLTRFETEKERAVLLYLAAEVGRPHRRDALAELLWPDRPEGSARANLRHAIYNLRNVLGDRRRGDKQTGGTPVLVAERNSIRLNGRAALWIDTRRFLQLVTEQESEQDVPISCLEEAVRLYRGSFLDGFLIGDSAAFQEWLLIKREQFEHLALKSLDQLAQYNELRGNIEKALSYANRQAELAPWDEQAHVRILRLLAYTGRRAEALALYEKYKRKLADELQVEPGSALKQIVQKIRNNALQMPASTITLVHRVRQDLISPGFLDPAQERDKRSVFVLRERELDKLNSLLQQMLQGQCQLAFVTGGPGIGKTTLLNEFAFRATAAHPHLLVASASCSALDQIGDSYLPFCDLMAMLRGDVLALWKAGTISSEQARRLWQARRLTIRAVVEEGSSLIDTIINGDDLLAYTAAALPDDIELLEQLTCLTECERAGSKMPAQHGFFEQFTDVLRLVARQHPLLLLIDDLQWLDRASTGLLFHLGRRLADSRVFIVCAYRPEEVALQAARDPVSLRNVLNEFKRTHGNVWVNLALADEKENRRFIDAHLDSEPNQLGEQFRISLLQLTSGHPLFTVEVLRSLKEHGDLVLAAEGWQEAPKLAWEALPARVEAVIEQRINRLDADLQRILATASVQGDVFEVRVLAHLLKKAEQVLLRQLSGELETRYRLVSLYMEVGTGQRPFIFYTFHHALIRNYLYQSLEESERVLLHLEVAAALEYLYGRDDDEVAAKIAQHFLEAGDHSRALPYIIRAAQLATRRCTYEEAVDLYSQSIELTEKIAIDNGSLAGLYLERGLVLQTIGDFGGARVDLEKAVQISHLAADSQREWQALLESGRLWTSRDYRQAKAFFEQSLIVARQLDDPLLLAGSLNWIGNWHLNAENPPVAVEHHLQALEVYEANGNKEDLANTLDLLGVACNIAGDSIASARYYGRAIALFRELDNRPRLAASLTGRATLGTATIVTQYSIPVIKPAEARKDLEESLKIAREINAQSEIAWALWSLSMLNIVEGNFEEALENADNAVSLTSDIGQLEWLAGNKVALGCAYYELFALDKAEHNLLEALLLGKELRSKHWVNVAADRLAVLYLSTNEISKAQSLLNTVISPQTPMDSAGKCLCWKTQAEVSLLQGCPSTALAIIDRLIASVPGKRSDTVIPSLWKIRADALAALGDLNASYALLKAALDKALKMGTRFICWRLHSSLGYVGLKMRHLDEAEAEFAVARACIEELSDPIQNKELKESFRQNAIRTVEAYEERYSPHRKPKLS